MLRPAIANEPDRERRARLDAARASSSPRSTCSPARRRWRRSGARATRELGAPTYRELYERFRFPLDTLAEQCRALPRGDGGPVRRQPSTALLPRAASASRSTRRGAPTSRGSSARPSGTRASRRTRCCRRSRGRSPTSASTCARQENVHLDIEPPPAEDAARVLRADRGARPRHARHPADRRPRRLARPLPRGRPHGALRAHRREPARREPPPGRQRRHRGLGDAPRAPRQRPGLALAPARLRPAGRLRRRGGRGAPLLRPPLLRPSSSTSSSCTATASSSRCGSATSSGCARRTKIEPSRVDFLADVDSGFYASCYLRAWALRGAAPHVPPGGVRKRLVHARARRARCFASSGTRARA